MDRDFLFGVLAVQLGQATPQQGMAAAAALLADKSRSISERLVADGVFTPERLAMLTTMVDDAVKAHGGDTKKTMESLRGEQALFASFGGSVVVDRAGHVSVASSSEGDSEDALAVEPEAPGRYRSGGGGAGAGRHRRKAEGGADRRQPRPRPGALLRRGYPGGGDDGS